MLVISCCAINRLSVSCPVFCVVECLIIKTVEKKHSKLPKYFPRCCLLLACGCCGDFVPVKGWGGCRAGAGAGSGWWDPPRELLCLPSCTPQTPAGAALAAPGQHRCPCLSGLFSCVLHSGESHAAFPCCWLGLLPLAHCQGLQVWEENLVPGEDLFIKWGTFVSPPERQFVVKCQGLWWMAVLSDGWPHRHAAHLYFLVRNS